MTKNKFWVDWSDPSYPEIKKWDGDYADPITFTEAKAQITQRFRALARHAHGQVNKIKWLRAGDVK